MKKTTIILLALIASVLTSAAQNINYKITIRLSMTVTRSSRPEWETSR